MFWKVSKEWMVLRPEYVVKTELNRVVEHFAYVQHLLYIQT